MDRFMRALGAPAVLTLLFPTSAIACACGCGIFDTGVTSITPQDSPSGLSAFVRFSPLDQDTNREAGHKASADDNADKRIQTEFYTVGVNYVIAHKWQVLAELPVIHRNFTTTGADAQGNPLIEKVPVTGLGDALISLTYAGFAPDMSTGIGFGVKLPTGRYTGPFDRYGNLPYDRDTLPGTGSTDLQVSAYHVGRITPAARWFAHAQFRFAVATRDAYRPGDEVDGAAGVTYDLQAGKTMLSPVIQVIGAIRGHDSGENSDPLNSGYQRVLLAPGLRVQLTRRLSVYGDVEFPIAQYVNSARSAAIEGTAGQLVAPAMFKMQVNFAI